MSTLLHISRFEPWIRNSNSVIRFNKFVCISKIFTIDFQSYKLLTQRKSPALLWKNITSFPYSLYNSIWLILHALYLLLKNEHFWHSHSTLNGRYIVRILPHQHYFSLVYISVGLNDWIWLLIYSLCNDFKSSINCKYFSSNATTDLFKTKTFSISFTIKFIDTHHIISVTSRMLITVACIKIKNKKQKQKN